METIAMMTCAFAAFMLLKTTGVKIAWGDFYKCCSCTLDAAIALKKLYM